MMLRWKGFPPSEGKDAQTRSGGGAAKPEREMTSARVKEKERRGKRHSVQFLRRETVLMLFRGFGLLILSFLFGRCEWFFSATPFGIAMLCAAESGVGWCFGGLLLTALPIFGGAFRPILLVVSVAAVLLRITVRMTVDMPWKKGESAEVRSFGSFCAALFSEHIALRAAVGAVAAFLLGLYGMIGGGFRVYDLLAAILMMVAVPVTVAFLSRLWKGGAGSLSDLWGVFSVAVLLAILVLSLSEKAFYDVALAPFTALGTTLWMTHRKGISYGILAGLLFGFAVDPITAPLYAFSALAAGALRRISVFMGALSALSVGMAWGFYVYGLSALSRLFPALLAASLLFCVLERLGLLPGRSDLPAKKEAQEALPKDDGIKADTTVDFGVEEERAEEDCLLALRSSLAAERLSEEERRIEDLCGAFLSVSDLLSALRENGKYPSVEELRRVCDRVCDEFCPGCISCTQCWGSEYARMAGTLGHIAEELHRNGRADPSAFPDEVRKRCSMSGAIFLRINEEAGAMTAAYLKREKAGLLSADYSAAAALFRSAAGRSTETYGIHEEKSRAGEQFLRERGMKPSRVAISGGRRGCLYAWGVERNAAERLFASLESKRTFFERIGFWPGEATLEAIPGGGGLCDLRIPAVPRYRVRHAYVSRPSCRNGREEGLCGDSIAVFEGRDGRVYALLSDGMGSGRNAARLSGICAVFLQKMLSCGGETEVVLRMLNDFLTAGTEGEASATVDLLEFDSYTGEGIFWKSGAAPSFVLREGNLFRLTSRTAPAGILPEADVQKTAFCLYHGDLVVMVSDGVADGDEELDFLETMLNGDECEEGTLLRAAERIADARGFAAAERALSLDDRSVILLSVREENDDLPKEDGVRAAC